MAPQIQFQGTRITGKGDPYPQVAPPTSKVVAGGTQCALRSTIIPTKTCSADLYRCIERRVERSLKRAHCKGNMVPSRKQAAQNLSAAEGHLFVPKRVPRPLLEQNSSHRQHHSGCLLRQGGGMKLGPLCALLWRTATWCSRKQVTLKARHIPGWLNVVAIFGKVEK